MLAAPVIPCLPVILHRVYDRRQPRNLMILSSVNGCHLNFMCMVGLASAQYTVLFLQPSD